MRLAGYKKQVRLSDRELEHPEPRPRRVPNAVVLATVTWLVACSIALGVYMDWLPARAWLGATSAAQRNDDMPQPDDTKQSDDMARSDDLAQPNDTVQSDDTALPDSASASGALSNGSAERNQRQAVARQAPPVTLPANDALPPSRSTVSSGYYGYAYEREITEPATEF